LLVRSLGLLVGALAEMVEADAPVAIDEVEGRPVVVLERPPDGEVVVQDDGVADVQFGDSAAHIVEVVLEPELGRVDADDEEPAVAIAIVPRPDVRQRAKPVHARVRPEVDEDEAPIQPLGGKWLGIEPDGRVVEGGEGHSRCPPNRSSASRKTLKMSRKMLAAIGTAASGVLRRRRLKS